MTEILEPSNEGPVAAKGKTDGGIYIPPGVTEYDEKGNVALYVPPGLEAVANLPDKGLTPPEENYGPTDFAKSSCKFCFGHGLVIVYNEELRADEQRLCACVETRIAKGLGPRKK